MNTELPTHMRKFVEHLRSMPPGASTSYKDCVEYFYDGLEGFDYAMELLAGGLQIYFSTSEDGWVNNACPEALYYHKATHAEDFDRMEEMIREQLCSVFRNLPESDLNPNHNNAFRDSPLCQYSMRRLDYRIY